MAFAAVVTVVPSVLSLSRASGVPTDANWGYVAEPPKAVSAAARLSDGTVLAAYPAHVSEESHCQGVCFGIYDPARDRWSDVAPKPLHNYGVLHITALRGEPGALVSYRGRDESQRTPTYRYDAVRDEWKLVAPSLPYNRNNGFTATLLEGGAAECGNNCGKVLIAGGINDHASNPVRWTADLYDPANDTITPTGAISQTRPGHNFGTAVQLADGRVLAVGGTAAGMPTRADLYNPAEGTAEGTWTAATDLPQGLEQVAYTMVRLHDGRVLVVGDAHDPPHPPVLFDPTEGEEDPLTLKHKGSWTAIDQCPAASRCGVAVVLADGSVMAFGIEEGKKAAFVLDPASLEDPAAPDWTRIEDVPLSDNDRFFAAVPLSGSADQCGANCGKVLALGGHIPNVTSWNTSEPTVAIYPAANLPTVTGVSPRSGFSCGGQQVTISGTGFSPATAVNFGDVAVPRAEFTVSPTGDTITVKAPPHLPGEVEVTVLAELRSAATPDATYTYNAVPPAALDGLTPIRGPASGGTSVDIKGSFAAECLQAVKFDDIPAAYTMANSAPGEPTDALVATSPPHEPGRARVTVEMRPGPSSPSAGPELPTLPTVPPLPTDPPPPEVDVFTYYPVITGLFPPTGPVAGDRKSVV